MEKELNSFRQDKVAKENEKKFKGVIADEAMKAMESGKQEKKEIERPFMARLENGTTIWAKSKKELIDAIRSHREGGF